MRLNIVLAIGCALLAVPLALLLGYRRGEADGQELFRLMAAEREAGYAMVRKQAQDACKGSLKDAPKR